MTNVAVPGTFAGLAPLDLARNGLPPSSQLARAIAGNANHLAGRCLQVLPGKEVLPSAARNSGSELALWRHRYRASANGTVLVSEVHLIPTQPGHAVGASGWYVKVDGSKATDAESGSADTQIHNVHVESGGGENLSDVFVRRQRISVTAGANHSLELWTLNGCRVVGWYLYEEPRSNLVVGTDSVVDPTHLQSMSYVRDSDMANLLNGVVDTHYQKTRGQCAWWSADDPATPTNAFGTVAANLWESTNTVKARCPAEYRNSYANDLAGTDTIDLYAWCYAERTAGAGNVLVRIVTSVGTYDITVNGAAGIYESTAVKLSAAAATDTVKLQYLVSAGGTTGNIYAVGVYPRIGT